MRKGGLADERSESRKEQDRSMIARERGRQLMEAARANDLHAARFALEKGADPTDAGDNLLTPLGVAARLDHAEVLLEMLEGMEPDELRRPNELLSAPGVNVLQEAARSGSERCCAVLLEAGFSPGHAEKGQLSARDWAKQRGHRAVALALGGKWTPSAEESAPRLADPSAAEPAAAEELLDRARAAKARSGLTKRVRDFFFGPPAQSVAPPALEAEPAESPASERRESGIRMERALSMLQECGLSPAGDSLARRARGLALELSPKGPMPAQGQDASELKRLWEVNLPMLLEAALAVPAEHRASRGDPSRRSPLEAVERTLEISVERMEGMLAQVLARAQARIEGEMAVIESNTSGWGRRSESDPSQADEPEPSSTLSRPRM